jgi:hypothetical protein
MACFHLKRPYDFPTPENFECPYAFCLDSKGRMVCGVPRVKNHYEVRFCPLYWDQLQEAKTRIQENNQT